MENGKKVKISVNFDMDFFVNFDKEDMVGINWETWIEELKENDNKSYRLFFNNIDFDSFLDNADDKSWKIKVEES
tara:strand:+ start:2002 stop:2226 length:225 start_codon:yes stop_codon:yes gene_type:complete